MKLFVVLSVLVASAAAYPGYLGYGHGHGLPQQVADTHEVAAAKAQHFAAVAEAQAQQAALGHDDGHYAHAHVGAVHAVPALSYGYAPVAYGVHAAVLAPGQDTHEVAAAKAQHFAAVAAAQAEHGAGHYAGHEDDGQYRGEGSHYAGAYAGHEDDGQYRGEGAHYAGHYAHGSVAVLAPGQDTHEVAAAKAQHFAAVAAAQAQHGAGHYAGHYAGHEDDGQYRGEGSHYAGQYAHGVAETHEVAVARAQHLAAHAAALHGAVGHHY